MKSLFLKVLLFIVAGALSQSCIKVTNLELEKQQSRLLQVESYLNSFESELYESLGLVINLPDEEVISTFSYASAQNRRKKHTYDICLDYRTPLLVHRNFDEGYRARVAVNFNNASVIKYCNDSKKKIDFLSKRNFVHKIKVHIVEKPINFVLLLSGRGVLSLDSNGRAISISQNALVETKVVDGSRISANQKLKIEFSSGGETYFSEIEMQIDNSKINLDDVYFKLIQKKDNVKVGYLKFSRGSSQEIGVYDVNKKLIIS